MNNIYDDMMSAMISPGLVSRRKQLFSDSKTTTDSGSASVSATEASSPTSITGFDRMDERKTSLRSIPLEPPPVFHTENHDVTKETMTTTITTTTKTKTKTKGVGRVHSRKSDSDAGTKNKLSTRQKKYQAMLKIRIVKLEKEVHKLEADASTKIQTIFRGFSARMHTKIEFLTIRLNDVECRRQVELDDIQRNKESFLTSHKEELMVAGIEKASNLEKHSEMITFLREQNKKIRKQNESMREAMADMRRENCFLAKQLEATKEEIAELKASIAESEKEVSAWTELLELFDTRGVEFEESLSIRTEWLTLERNTVSRYANRIEEIVRTINTDCSTAALRDEVGAIVANNTVATQMKSESESGR